MFKWGLKLKLLKQIRYRSSREYLSIACQNNDYKGIEVKIIKSENDPHIYAYTRHFIHSHKKVQAYPQFPRGRNVANFQTFCFSVFRDYFYVFQETLYLETLGH